MKGHRLAEAQRPRFISGALGKKMGLTVESTKGEDGDATIRQTLIQGNWVLPSAGVPPRRLFFVFDAATA